MSDRSTSGDGHTEAVARDALAALRGAADDVRAGDDRDDLAEWIDAEADELAERLEAADGSTFSTPHEIFVVSGEAGVSHYAFTDEEDAEAVVDHWRENAYVIGSVDSVELHSELRGDGDAE